MWAFSDESERAGVMLLDVVLVSPGEVAGARRSLRALLLPGQRQVHTAKESPRRRRAVLDPPAGRPVGYGHGTLYYLAPSAGTTSDLDRVGLPGCR